MRGGLKRKRFGRMRFVQSASATRLSAARCAHVLLHELADNRMEQVSALSGSRSTGPSPAIDLPLVARRGRD
jgi:hypothetical protein